MSDDYMTARGELLRLRFNPSFDNQTRARACDFQERLDSLRCLSRDVMLRLVSNPEMADAPAGAIASRSVALAECLLAELAKVEAGEFTTEEENMKQGTLFGLFRQWYYKNRSEEGGGP